jgi:hypothetical protein
MSDGHLVLLKIMFPQIDKLLEVFDTDDLGVRCEVVKHRGDWGVVSPRRGSVFTSQSPCPRSKRRGDFPCQSPRAASPYDVLTKSSGEDEVWMKIVRSVFSHSRYPLPLPTSRTAQCCLSAEGNSGRRFSVAWACMCGAEIVAPNPIRLAWGQWRHECPHCRGPLACPGSHLPRSTMGVGPGCGNACSGQRVVEIEGAVRESRRRAVLTEESPRRPHRFRGRNAPYRPSS